MYRIKDPKVSLKFYSDILGMSLLKRLDFPAMSNWGTEKDPRFQGHHNGNSETRGFGEIKGIAFIKDPDGYWIEIFDRENITNVAKATDAKP
ncbi:hypothetical protein L1987_00504 [Smallanthus sonchifolius]|uniref:Uncharacterized protein n=1 Tax=Smallanthus sonchifolius TaxID=185202 RepID=A0ACB9K2A9_9ASTR|nr:hypothetical protein L1987_00504 [Smallanthus sonchifolius]